MNYFISEMISGNLLIDVEEQFEDQLIGYLKSQFNFHSIEFDDFILILQFSPESKVGKFGKDRIQVSKKERTVFLGVNLINEYFEKGDIRLQLDYIISRIEQVKAENLSRLIKIGLSK